MKREGDVSSLESFHPLVHDWFLARFREPTAVQEGVWAALRRDEHVLAEAPTGNGKTLAAFLHALSALISGELPADRLSVLYISPLKALNEDIRRNLEDPISEINELAVSRNLLIPSLSVVTRSGDTPEAARRRFLRRPPSILCTTPESFALLLDSPRARPILSTVSLLVVDEIHALAGNKRGALLSCCVGRLGL
ncbi:MAG: DEAD/DEAH box helicase, partial [Spirochaetota bacterium]